MVLQGCSYCYIKIYCHTEKGDRWKGRYIIVDMKLGDKVTLWLFFMHPQEISKETGWMNSLTSSNCLIILPWKMSYWKLIWMYTWILDTSDNPEYRSNINSFLEIHDMINIWRTTNPFLKVLTSHRGKAKF